MPHVAADDADAVRRARAEAARDRQVAGPAERHLAVGDAAGQGVAQEPAAGAEHREPVAAVAVPVAHDGDVVARAEPEPDRLAGDAEGRRAVVVPAGIAASRRRPSRRPAAARRPAAPAARPRRVPAVTTKPGDRSPSRERANEPV